MGNSAAGTSARGSGAGTTELELFEGKWVNKNSITLKNGAGSVVALLLETLPELGETYQAENVGEELVDLAEQQEQFLVLHPA